MCPPLPVVQRVVRNVALISEYLQIPNLKVDGHEGRFLHTFKVSSSRSTSVKHSQWWINRDYFFAAIDGDELSSVTSHPCKTFWKRCVRRPFLLWRQKGKWYLHVLWSHVIPTPHDTILSQTVAGGHPTRAHDSRGRICRCRCNILANIWAPWGQFQLHRKGRYRSIIATAFHIHCKCVPSPTVLFHRGPSLF